MKRSIIAVLCAAMLLLPLAAPAMAAADNSVITVNLQSDEPVQHWRITMGAVVVANTGDNLVVHLGSPRSIATADSDIVDALQTLPLTGETSFSDSRGNAVAAEAVLPGQEVRVTFRYHWMDSTPRMTQMDHCLAVELVGDAKTAVSTAAVDDFGRDELVGTVVAVNGRQLEVYIESGRVYHGSVEYMVRGRQRVELPANATILGTDGRVTALSAIRPYQRVVLRASDSMWAESMPPQLALQQADRVQLLADGEKLLPPATLAAQNRMTATVLQIRQTESGTVYIVQPAEHSRERRLADSFQVAAPLFADFDEEQQAVLAAIQTGTVLEIHYAGLVYGGADPARIDWAHSFQLAG